MFLNKFEKKNHLNDDADDVMMMVFVMMMLMLRPVVKKLSKLYCRLSFIPLAYFCIKPNVC